MAADSDKGKGIGSLNCRLCGANFADRVNCEWARRACTTSHPCGSQILSHTLCMHRLLTADLTKPIDIYCSWIDACEEANGVAETEDDLRRQLAEMAAGGGAA